MAKRELTAEQRAAMERNLALGRQRKQERLALKPAGSEAPDPDEPVTEPDEAVPLELTDAEMARIREEAKKKVDEELRLRAAAERKEKIAAALDAETRRQRREAGLTNHLDDLVEIMIDVAPFTDNITIDGTVYQHGMWYTVDRRKADVMREIMARSWDSEERAGNPNRKFRREQAGTMNPMAREQRLADGTLTWGGAAATVDRNASVVRH